MHYHYAYLMSMLPASACSARASGALAWASGTLSFLSVEARSQQLLILVTIHSRHDLHVGSMALAAHVIIKLL